MNKLSGFSLVVAGMCVLISCGAPPRPSVPALTPENAATLLRNDNRAQNWITLVRKRNAACGYQLDLPDQSAHPSTIDLTHIVLCGGVPSPKEFDASVSFEYDKDAQHWAVSRFSS